MSSKKAGRPPAKQVAKRGRRRTSSPRPIAAATAPVTAPARPASRPAISYGRRSWQGRLDRLLAGTKAGSLPAPLERVIGAEALTWVALLIVVPILAVGLSLTVGLWIDQLPRVDNDYWWHLATGGWIIDERHVPDTDPFSWTHGGEDWIAHEWLGALLFALADRIAE